MTRPGYFVVFIFYFSNTLLSLGAQSVWILWRYMIFEAYLKSEVVK